jgi:hypothetical protein
MASTVKDVVRKMKEAQWFSKQPGASRKFKKKKRQLANNLANVISAEAKSVGIELFLGCGHPPLRAKLGPKSQRLFDDFCRWLSRQYVLS